MNIPSVQRCLNIMAEEEMLPNIRAHSMMVARVAHLLLSLLKENTNSSTAYPLPDESLVLAGGLLHDIAKTPCLENGCHHARKGRDLMERMAFPEVGEVVREHVWLFEFSEERYKNGHFYAKELVYYADKRVRHDKIVSLAEREDYILERYGNNDPERHGLIRENFSNCRLLEKHMFDTVGVHKNQIANLAAVHRIPGIKL